ncbi:MAG: AAA family ATPase [Cypionkella sp.]
MSELRFPDALLDQIRAAVPITDIVGQHVIWDDKKSIPAKGDLWACCPFHGEKSPSFHAENSKGIYHCFGCGVTGDHFRFLQERAGMEFPDAVRFVARIAGIDAGEAPQGLSAAPQPHEASKPTNEPQEQESLPVDAPQAKEVVIKGYRYTDGDGEHLYDVIRYQFQYPDGTWQMGKNGNPKKTFKQRRPNGNGGFIWGLGDVQTTIYRRQAVEMAVAEGKTIGLTEGEKDVETLEAWDMVGTTNSGGAQGWKPEFAEFLRGADVVIYGDDDEAGRTRVETVALSLRGIAGRIRAITEWGGHKDVTDWKEAGGTVEQLVQIMHTLPDWRPRPPTTTFGADTSRNVAEAPIVYDWLVKGLIERQGVFIIAGESQAGKSFFVKDLGMKIARGIEYGGRRVRQGVVIHVAVEDGRGTKLRQKGYRKHHGISPDIDIPYVIMDPSAGQGFTLMADESVDRLIAEVKAWADYYGMPVELIIIDTLSVSTEGLDEINGAEAGKVMARVNRLRDATGAAIGLVHHMNASGNRVRGHSSIVANVPNVIEIRPMMTIPQNKNAKPEPIYDANGRQMRRAILTKNKNGLNDIKWTFILEIVPLGFDEDGDPITTCVCAKAARQQRDDDADDKHKMSPDTKLVYDALQAGLYQSGQDMPQGSLAGPQVKRCVSIAAFEAMVRKTMTFAAPDTEIEARNRELTTLVKRTTTTLINAGYMGRDNDLKICWWTGKTDRQRPRHYEQERPQEQPGAGISEEVKRELASGEPPF